MSSKIEQAIDEIEDFIENCKFKSFSNTQIIVDKEELDNLLAELRHRTPDEIKRYQKMISNKEAILADAKAKAEAIIAKAEVHTTELISEHQIMQQAYAQANEVVLIATNQAQEILDNATIDANNIRLGAIQYTDEMLNSLEEIIVTAMETTSARTDSLLGSLQACFDKVNANRRELAPAEMDAVQSQEAQGDSAGGRETPSAIQLTDIN
ncbi:MAG: ATPase [Lachnospiraceae bacterium]|nr:ATPase [Lachnospiraceae bacterium]